MRYASAANRSEHHGGRLRNCCLSGILKWLRLILMGVMATTSVLAMAQPLHLGFTQIAQPGGGQISIFYPTRAEETGIKQGPFSLSWARDAAPVSGNHRLIVISHGSGGSPWVHADLARTLVNHGYVVAIPLHKADNYQDGSRPGPDSWIIRPLEISQAIDVMAATEPFASILSTDRVGVFGGSAGGHTALSLAGGKWSPSRFRDHCLAHIEADFSSCVGFITLLRGNGLDGFKLWIAKHYISWHFSDPQLYGHTDDRIVAAVAMVPFAADFEISSLKNPKIALGIVSAGKDINQIPLYHSGRVEQACLPRCELLMHLEMGSHGAMLSPLPPFEKGSIAERLLSDPPAFNRPETIPILNGRIADFFDRQIQKAQ